MTKYETYQSYKNNKVLSGLGGFATLDNRDYNSTNELCGSHIQQQEQFQEEELIQSNLGVTMRNLFSEEAQQQSSAASQMQLQAAMQHQSGNYGYASLDPTADPNYAPMSQKGKMGAPP